ncbi:MAG: hypothetical protein OSB18_13255 [SAR324 cluster bacterium]|nr:hypothetical protein [SAR324 cluster bacterium]
MLYNGETENVWLADLMVGWGGDYRKVGSSSQSERLTKHNRLPVLDRKMGLACENCSFLRFFLRAGRGF